MKKTILLLCALPLTALLACGEKTTDTSEETTEEETTEEETTEEETETESNAFVRVVHLSPDAPAVDVYVNGSTVGLDNVPFPAASDYLTVTSGEYKFEVAPTGTSYDDVVPASLEATLEEGVFYTGIAHGYLGENENNNGFAITPFVQDMSEITEGFFRAQVVHAAAGLGQVDIWDITDAENPQPFIVDFDYGADVTAEVPKGVAISLGADVDDDAVPDVVFNLPDSLSGFVGVYATNDRDGNVFLFAHLEDGTTVRIDPS